MINIDLGKFSKVLAGLVVIFASTSGEAREISTLKGVLRTQNTVPLLSVSTEGRYPVASIRVNHEGRPVQLGLFENSMGTCSISFANYSHRFQNDVTYSIPAGTEFTEATILRTKRSRSLMTGPYIEFVAVIEGRLENSDKVTSVIECRRTVEDTDPAKGYTVEEIARVLAPHALTIE